MTRSVRVCMVCLLPLATSWALAGQPYKCVGADGKITFTDQKCDAEAQPQRVWDSHLGAPDPAPDASAATQDAPQAASQQVGRSPQGELRSGYACSTGQHDWVQLSPCPRFLNETRVTRISHSDGTWTNVESEHPALVLQTQIDHDSVCARLSGDAGISSYDKNQMRDRAECH